jgi:hypothetical protein
MMTLVAFAWAAPAMAIKRVPKSDRNPTNALQKQDRGQQSTATEPSPQPPDRPVDNRDDKGGGGRAGNPPSDKRPSDDSGQKDRFKDRDRFIDEDDDGLNDKMKKPPEKIKRKKDSGGASKERRDR